MIVSCAAKRRLRVKRMRLSPLDPSSFSRPESVIIKKMYIILAADFERKVFHGSAELFVEKIDPDATEIVLDSKDLTISEIYEVNLHTYLNYSLSKPYKEFGSKLVVELPPTTGKKRYTLSVRYETSRKASGLYWVQPERTFGKEHPFVYSHFLPIHARSFLPCQDTPSVRVTYSALITVPYYMTVLMSSPRHQKRDLGDLSTFYFTQKVPIPVYLIAIAIGALQSIQISPRFYIWSEPEITGKAVKEFQDLEMQLSLAEQICGPCLWNVCDLLVLPPNYPYESLAHPGLIYIPSHSITGDKKSINTIFYDVVQGWLENIITNRNFEDFWLHKALTLLVGRKVIGYLSSLADMDFLVYRGRFELIRTVDFLGYESPLTSLIPDLSNRYPDESFTQIPYEKGYIFLRYLEVLVGGPEVFESFLRLFIDTFKFKVIDSETFQSFFEFYFIENECSWKVDWRSWLYMTGMPPVVSGYDNSRFEELITCKKRWLQWDETSEEIPFNQDDTKTMSSIFIAQLLQEMLEQEPQSIKKLQQLNKVFKFDKTKNPEIKYKWLLLSIKAHWIEKVQNVLDWINEIGSMKFIRTLYKALYNWEEVRDQTLNNFRQNCWKMPYACVYQIVKDLSLEDDIVCNKKKYLVLKCPSFSLFAPREVFHYCNCSKCIK